MVDWENRNCRNTILDAEIKAWKEHGTNVYPSVVINGKGYRGQIEPLSVFNALCSAFKEPPSMCDQTLGKLNTVALPPLIDVVEETMVTVGEVTALIIAVIMTNVVVLYCCRRRARREMAQQMSLQIESQVGQYIALSKTSTTASK